MKRYRFRLAQVQRVRSIELDQAVGEVARARTELHAAEQRTVQFEQHYRTLGGPPASVTPDELRTNLETRRLAGDAIVSSRAAARVKAGELDQRLADWSEADKKVRLLEELDGRARQRHDAETLAEEQQSLDDLVTSRMGRDGA